MPCSKFALPRLTNLMSYNLSVMMWDSNNVYRRADYSTFVITNNSTYNLSIAGFRSDQGWRVQGQILLNLFCLKRHIPV